MNKELPLLPHPWYWYARRSDTSDAYMFIAYMLHHTDMLTETIRRVPTEVSASTAGLTVSNDDDRNPEPIPFTVLSAVLKANGVEL